MQGIEAVSVTLDLPTSIARPYTFEDLRGVFGIVADTERQLVVGAWAVAPLAGEWIHQAVLAILAEIPIAVLKDAIAQFPTLSEAFGTALRSLPDAPDEMMEHRPPLMTAEPLATGA